MSAMTLLGIAMLAGGGLAALVVAALNRGAEGVSEARPAPSIARAPMSCLSCVFVGAKALCEFKPGSTARPGDPAVCRFYSEAGEPLWTRGEGWTPTIFKPMTRGEGVRALPARSDLRLYDTALTRMWREAEELEKGLRAGVRAAEPRLGRSL